MAYALSPCPKNMFSDRYSYRYRIFEFISTWLRYRPVFISLPPFFTPPTDLEGRQTRRRPGNGQSSFSCILDTPVDSWTTTHTIDLTRPEFSISYNGLYHFFVHFFLFMLYFFYHYDTFKSLILFVHSNPAVPVTSTVYSLEWGRVLYKGFIVPYTQY